MKTDPQPGPLRPRRPPPSFQPRFSLMLVYLFAFFMVFSFMLVLPALLEVLGTVEPGPQQEEAAKLAAQEAMRGKVLPSALLAVLATGAGAYFEVLPGLRTSAR